MPVLNTLTEACTFQALPIKVLVLDKGVWTNPTAGSSNYVRLITADITG